MLRLCCQLKDAEVIADSVDPDQIALLSICTVCQERRIITIIKTLLHVHIGGTGVSWSENCIFLYDEVGTHKMVFFLYNQFPNLFYCFSFGK